MLPPAPNASAVSSRPNWREPARFVLFGSANTLLAYGLYVLLLQFVPYGFAYSISYVAGIYISYCLNVLLVFKEPLRISSAIQYPAIYVVQYGFAIALLYVLVEWAGLSTVIAPFAIALLNIPLAYTLSRYVIKRRHPTNPQAGRT